MLFSEGAEAWREARRHADSELHLMPRLKTQVVFSNSIKKDYKLLPRYIFLTLLLSSSFSIFAYPATLNFLIVLKYQLKVEVIIICLVHRYKLNISLSSLKFNLSQRTIASVLDFLDTLPVPVPNTVPVSFMDSGDYVEFEEPEQALLMLDKVSLQK